MEIRILYPHEIQQASTVAKGVFECCLQQTIPQIAAVQDFLSYVNAENLANLVSCGRLTLWGVFEDNQLCAMSGMQAEGHISMLYVMPVYQRRGYGRQMIHEMRKYAREKYHHTTITVNAMPAWTVTFFERIGFRRIGTPQYGMVLYISLEAKTIEEVNYPVKPIHEGVFIGVVCGFLGVMTLMSIVFLLLW